MKVLYSWVGHADLNGFLAKLEDGDLKEKTKAIVGKSFKETDMPGPIETAVKNLSFDKVVLLWSYLEKSPAKHYADYIGNECNIVFLPVANPIDYREIYTAVDKTLEEQEGNSELQRSIMLSSGTPAMAAVWLLLGKTKYPSAFLQAYNGKIMDTEIPFDLKVFHFLVLSFFLNVLFSEKLNLIRFEF